MKKILILFLCFTFILGLSSCASKNDEVMSNDSNMYIEVDEKFKQEINKAKGESANVKWSSPYEVDHFESYNELEEFKKSFIGMRLCGKYGDKYLLLYYSTYHFGDESCLYYDYDNNDTLILSTHDNTAACNVFKYAFVYSKGKISQIFSLKGNINITYEQALKLRDMQYYYNEKYFYKFLTEEEKKTNEYRYVYHRLSDEVVSKQESNQNTTCC